MDDWQIGDLALCVAGLDSVPPGYEARSPNECPKIVESLAPSVGSKWRVAGVECVFRQEEQRDLIYLSLIGQPSSHVYDARFFRKIRPLSDAERESFLADLREPSHDLITAALSRSQADALPNAGVGHPPKLNQTHFHAVEVSDV